MAFGMNNNTNASTVCISDVLQLSAQSESTSSSSSLSADLSVCPMEWTAEERLPTPAFENNLQVGPQIVIFDHSTLITSPRHSTDSSSTSESSKIEEKQEQPEEERVQTCFSRIFWVHLPLYLLMDFWLTYKYTLDDIAVTLDSYGPFHLWHLAMFWGVPLANQAAKMSHSLRNTVIFGGKATVIKKMMTQIEKVYPCEPGQSSALTHPDDGHNPPNPVMCLLPHFFNNFSNQLTTIQKEIPPAAPSSDVEQLFKDIGADPSHFQCFVALPRKLQLLVQFIRSSEPVVVNGLNMIPLRLDQYGYLQMRWVVTEEVYLSHYGPATCTSVEPMRAMISGILYCLTDIEIHCKPTNSKLLVLEKPRQIRHSRKQGKKRKASAVDESEPMSHNLLDEIKNETKNEATEEPSPPKKLKAPKAPKAPKEPKMPKQPKAPKVQKAPKAPKGPKIPKIPKIPKVKTKTMEKEKSKKKPGRKSKAVKIEEDLSHSSSSSTVSIMPPVNTKIDNNV
jgi:hypothetical protein